MTGQARRWLGEIATALDGGGALPVVGPPEVQFVGDGALPSVFAVTDLAAGAIAAVGAELAALVAARAGRKPRVTVDRRLSSFWFGMTLRPQGWALPSAWDALAGDYATADGWIRLHTNAPHHRRAAMAVLRCAEDRHAVTRAVAGWATDALEAAIVAQGGCAATMRSCAAWGVHPQGQAVAGEALLAWSPTEARLSAPDWPLRADRPLQGIRVLDLTRVLAGPVATRLLAGYGADVLRIDPPDWDEPAVVPEVTLGKRCARLNLQQAADRQTFETLLRGADVLVHGYRADALSRLGFGTDWRRSINPGLIEVSLNAYGWTGPWCNRRGFDSLVQMSSGIAEAGMQATAAQKPVPLPVQALDHAAGYLLAAAAIRGLRLRMTTGAGAGVRTSLARVAALLVGGRQAPDLSALEPETAADVTAAVEHTAWGPAHRVRPPLTVAGAPLRWDVPAGPLGTVSAKSGWVAG
jgi:crotonobetainyl-CoA:carnitine CoA-transferase CaiB-like acyl-CoA transferase